MTDPDQLDYNATVSSTRRSGAAVNTSRRVQLNFADPTTARILPGGDLVDAVLFDTSDAATSYQKDDIVAVLSMGTPASVVQPQPSRYSVAAVQVIADDDGVQLVRLLLVGLGR